MQFALNLAIYGIICHKLHAACMLASLPSTALTWARIISMPVSQSGPDGARRLERSTY